MFKCSCYEYPIPQSTHRKLDLPHVSVQHGAGVERGKSATVGGLLGGVQLERLGGTAWKRDTIEVMLSCVMSHGLSEG